MAHGQEEPGTGEWRARYKRPDGTWGSRSGFPTKKAAEDWGVEQEALIRRNLWLDPRDGETRFDDFAEEWLAAVAPRLELNTVAKYRSFLDSQLLPQWKAWPLVAIFNGYVEIERWLSELYEDYAERLVATPAQAPRAAMRLYELGLGMSGFVLCLMDFSTGARWGELVGQQRHEYDSERRGIEIRTPLKEVGGKVCKGGRKSDDHHSDDRQRPPTRRGNSRPKEGRTKTPAGTRFVALPPGIAVLYEELMGSHRDPFVLSTPEGHPWRRSNRGGGAAATHPADIHLPRGPTHAQHLAGRGRNPGGRATGAARSEDEGHRPGLRPRDPGDGQPDPRRLGGTLAPIAGILVSGGAGEAGVVVPAPAVPAGDRARFWGHRRIVAD
jgi:hypothetical protein